jgi:hypothetical protein
MTRPSTIRAKTGQYKHPRVQQVFAEILVFAPMNRTNQLNAALVAATGDPNDALFGRILLSDDGQEPATHSLAKFRISWATNTRSLIQQLAGSNNPNIQAVLWPAGHRGDLTELQSDYAMNPNITIFATEPNVDEWLAGHSLQRIQPEGV